jgi:hypothetical protein
VRRRSLFSCSFFSTLFLLIHPHTLRLTPSPSLVYSIVKNDTVSRALQRGILDGDCLAAFEYLSIDLQTELAEAANTDADTVRANVRSLRGWE